MARLDTRVVDLAAAAIDATDELEVAMDGADSLVHLAWQPSDEKGVTSAGRAAAALANRSALLRVLRAASEVGVDDVVYVSSATVYGAWPDNKIPLTEDARIRPNPEFDFAVSKAESERVLGDWAADHSASRVAVLRPAVTVGAGPRPIYQALGVTRSPRLADERRPVQYLHVDDLASAVVTAWERSLAGVFNVAPDGGIPEEDARALAGGVARIAVPDRFAGFLADAGWRLWRRGVPTAARAYATHPWVIAPDRLKAQGWTPSYTSEEALVATDSRVHWGDLPAGRRRAFNLLLGASGVAVAAAGFAAGVVALRRRQRSP